MKPHLTPETPRLTDSGEYRAAKHPHVCQICGGSNRPGVGNGLMRVSLDRWQEADHNDRFEQRVVVLCGKCSDRVIADHPRLYQRLDANQPWPGCMDICVGCKLRDGVRCTSPDAKANGGTGVLLSVAPPVHAMVDGAKYRGPITFWTSPAGACKQRVEA